MRGNLLLKIGFVVVALCFFTTATVAQKNYKDLVYPELSNLEVPQIKQVTLSSGMKVFLLEDHELPLIRISGRIRSGSIYESSDKVGLASIVGDVMRTGGTLTRTGDEIDEELEHIAASVETSIGLDSGFASMSVLKEDLDIGLSVLADILMNPSFPEDKIELAKIEQRSAISRRNDNVHSIAFREFKKLIYGPESVYARYPEYGTVDGIIRQDLVEFHGEFFHPNNVMLAVSGDFDTSFMIKKIEEVFREWKPQEIQFPEISVVDYQFRQTVSVVQKDDTNQTNIYMGHIGGLMNDPDYFPLVLMNRVLGIGFTSRLFREVRSRQGLAYSVFGTFSAEFDHPGLFYVGCQTKSETTVRAIRAMIEQIWKMTQDEIKDEELEGARESYLNSFIFKFDSKREIANRLMTYAYYGYPLEFLQMTKEKIKKVTKADILRVARKHLKPDYLQILAVGRTQDFDQSLSTLGIVKEIDVTIPTLLPK